MNKWIIGIVILGLGVVVGWNLFGERTPTPAQSETTTDVTPKAQETLTPAVGAATPSSASSDAVTKGGTQERVLVVYGPNGFVPSPITVKVGTTVAFSNESANPMWVASDVHPTHSLLPGFDALKSIGKGQTYEYTFVKVGTWKYHNHMNPTDTGIVVVSQ